MSSLTTSGALRVAIGAIVCVLGCAALTCAQSSSSTQDDADAPAIRRWIDVQHVQLAARYRRIVSTDGEVSSNSLQWQPQVRARFLIDPKAKLSVHVGAFSGSSFISGWNDTGLGIGDPTGTFNVKQIFVDVAPLRGLDLQVGSLYVLRGENTEITTYDSDAFITGERIDWRPSRGPLTQVAVTAGYLGDLRLPNAFDRMNRMNDWNYVQALVGGHIAPGVTASADYTYQDGDDILREGISIALEGLLASMKVELYQRVSKDVAQGFNMAVDIQPVTPLRITAGIKMIDFAYGIANDEVNGDRYLRGSHVYTQGTYTLSRDLSAGWVYLEGFGNDQPISNNRRFELLVTFNPTARLKEKGVF
jgi:hypothetical protein